MSEQPPSVYQYSVKLEMGAKGDIKPTIHLYHNERIAVCEMAINMLKETIERLMKEGYTIPGIDTK